MNHDDDDEPRCPAGWWIIGLPFIGIALYVFCWIVGRILFG